MWLLLNAELFVCFEVKLAGIIDMIVKNLFQIVFQIKQPSKPENRRKAAA